MPPKRKATTDAQTRTTRKSARRLGAVQELGPSELREAKKRTRAQFTASPPAVAVRRSARARSKPATQALDGLKVLDGPYCDPFDDPDDAPVSQARGCQRAEVTIGPGAGVPADMGTNAQAEFPRVLAYAIERYGRNFKSGHAINADFAKLAGSDYRNLTCLTNSANGQQNAFDNPIRKARVILQHAYEAINKGVPRDPNFLKDLGYGIKIVITMSDEAWGDDFPENCISEMMVCEAEVVGAPSAEILRNALVGASKTQQIRSAMGYIKEVAKMVDAVNPTIVVNGRATIEASTRRRVVAKRRSSSQ
jgi:hypothetical protein